MDFHALMRKKLGGKYDQPKFTEDNSAREDIVANDNAIEVAEETDTEEDGQLTPPTKRPQLDITLTPPPKESTPAKQDKQGKKKATFKPRVQCGDCNFVGMEGREMDMHKSKKHKKKKECDECHFVADISIVFRRHKIQKHQQKCESCEFTSATPSALKIHNQAEHGGGVLRTSAGFMITSDASNDVCEEEPPQQGSDIQKSMKKLTKCEYLQREKEVNLENKSRKDIVRSFKDVFKNLKKKVANLQKQHGAHPEYILIVKNNVQNAGGKNPSPTGGLYMVCGEGELLSEFLKNGIKFDDKFVMMANQYDMETKKVNVENMAEGP